MHIYIYICSDCSMHRTHLCLYIYIYIYICAYIFVWCSSMQGIYASIDWGGPMLQLYWCIYALSIGLHATYVTGDVTNIWCSGIQGIYAQLTGEDLCYDCIGYMCIVYIYMSQVLEKRFRKRDKEVWSSPLYLGLFSMDAGRCADELWQFCCTCTVVFLP